MKGGNRNGITNECSTIQVTLSNSKEADDENISRDMSFIFKCNMLCISALFNVDYSVKDGN